MLDAYVILGSQRYAPLQRGPGCPVHVLYCEAFMSRIRLHCICL